MNEKKKELAWRIEQIDNILETAKKADIHDLTMKWLNIKRGLEEAFLIVFDQPYIDYWIEQMETEEE